MSRRAVEYPDRLQSIGVSSNFRLLFSNPLFAGDIHVASFITCVSVRAYRLRVIDCLRATRAGRQLRR